MRHCILTLMWRVRLMKCTRMISATLFLLLDVDVLAYAHGDYTKRVMAIGASSAGKDMHDAGAFLRCRIGFYSFFSLFFCADAG